MITSINLCGIPFQSSTDSTRLQMSSKQIQQTLTHLNCQIPYIIDENYDILVRNSSEGIRLAENDGKVIYRNDDIMVVLYNDDRIEFYETPKYKKTHSIFATSLRNSLAQGNEFRKDDILYEYDCFTNGVPSWGYNVFTAYDVFAGFNHEDAIVFSENFANTSRCILCEKLYIPIYEHTLLDPIYKDSGEFIYFPGINKPIKNQIVYQNLLPKSVSNQFTNHKDLKSEINNILKTMKLSDFISLKHSTPDSSLIKDSVKTKIEDGILTGIKVHKINRNKKLIDQSLQNVLEKLYTIYINEFVVPTYTDLIGCVSESLAKQLLRRFYVYSDSQATKKRGKINFNDAVYLLEFEITSEQKSYYGDKFSNAYAGKGVCSLILPDELRPVALNTNKPIDFIFNPFGVYSRMNHGQLINGAIAKTIMFCDNHIKEDPDSVKEIITWLNDNIIRHINQDESYYNRVNNQIIANLERRDFREEFLKSINETNLFIEAPSFSRVNIDEISKNWISPNEPVLIKKKTIEYIRQKLKLENDFVITSDIIRDNIFCVPMYTTKLYKLTKSIYNTRDFGAVKTVTQQPVKGRALSGGSRLGQMEIEALASHGVETVMKEFLTVKSDHASEKRNLVSQVLKENQYEMGNIESVGRTRKIVSTILEFLKE